VKTELYKLKEFDEFHAEHKHDSNCSTHISIVALINPSTKHETKRKLFVKVLRTMECLDLSK
jgi:hypothetical protein